MLGGEGNKNGEKNNNRSNQQKNNFASAAHFFCTFPCRCFARYNVKLPETSWLHVLWRKCRTCSCSLFFHCRLFSPWWPLAFLIFSIPLQNFMLFPQKISFILPISLQLFFSLSFPGLSPYFPFFSVFLFPYSPNLWT